MPAKNIAAYPSVIITTCVASQMFVSSTATKTFSVSPSIDKLCAITNVTKPMNVETTTPIPSRKIRSKINPNTTEPQPTNTADEYKFVTGGRPSKYIR